MNKKSISFNTVIFSVKSILSALFPLVTYPYVLRMLGVESMGKYNFLNSVIGYFQILGSLGIVSYARRDGAIIRNDKKRISRFASEVFSCNMIFTIIAYALFVMCIFFVPRIQNNYILALVLSTSMFFSVFGVEWIYNVYEDYIYITVRQIVIQTVSLILLFVFVHNKDDLLLYAGITVIASGGGNIFNFIHSKKYCNIRLTKQCNFKRHLQKTLIFFTSGIMVTIYSNTDQTMLGFMCNDYTVGLYSASVKIYHFLGLIITASSIVGVATLANLFGSNKKEEYDRTAFHIFSIIITLTVPVVVGGVVFSKDMVLLFGGIEYIQSVSSLRILIVGLLGYSIAVFWGQCVLVATGKERILLYITTISAIINLVGNFILIPYFKQDAAAFTTLISEAFTAVFTWIMGRKLVTIGDGNKVIGQSVIGGLLVFSISMICKKLIDYWLMAFVVSFVIGIVGYFTIEFLIGNYFVKETASKYIHYLKERFDNHE